MKKFWFKPGFVAMAGVLSLAVLFSACKKNNESQSLPVAGLMVFNLAPDKNQAGFTLSGNSLTYSPLSYSSFTGYYLNVYPGSRAVEAYDQTGTVASATTNFEVDKYYSAFLLGANGNYRNLIVKDNIDTLTAPNGVAYVRYINAIPDSSKPQVNITTGDNTLFNSPAGFATVSDFAAVAPGELSINLSNGGAINASRTITLESRKVYTVLLQGIPGHADQDKTVQIKFIANGQVNP
jgi:hypothetical protein